MAISTRAVRHAVVLLLCLSTALACDTNGGAGSGAEASGGSANSGGGEGIGGVPTPGDGASGGSTASGGRANSGGEGIGGVPAPGSGGAKGGAKPSRLKIPPWDRDTRPFGEVGEGKRNWDDLTALFVERCGGQSLCVTLVREYRDDAPIETVCGYWHMEPASGETVDPYTTVKVVGKGPCDPRTDQPIGESPPVEPSPDSSPPSVPPVTPPPVPPISSPSDSSTTAAPGAS